jgi:hypothetical protein
MCSTNIINFISNLFVGDIEPSVKKENKIMQDLIKKFNQEMEEAYSNKNSPFKVDSTLILTGMEETLSAIEKIHKQDPFLCSDKEIDEMNKKFQNFMNFTSQQLLHSNSVKLGIQDDLNHLKDLATLPEKSTYRAFSDQEFYNPKVTLLELNEFFEEFRKNWNYQGISIFMKKNEIYDVIDSERMFTVIFFRKKNNNEKIFNSEIKLFFSNNYRRITAAVPKDFFWSGYTPKAFTYDNPKKHLEAIELPLETWGYSDFKAGDVEEDFFKEGEKSEFGCYLILYHKKKK